MIRVVARAEDVRKVVVEVLESKRDEVDLSGHDDGTPLGLDSLEVVAVMVALERRFGVKFTHDQLTQETFATIDSMCREIDSLA